MKHVMKMLFFMTVLAGVFSACSDKDDEGPQYGEAKLTSFGFYAEDNEGILFKDYVQTSISSTSIKINLPEAADKTKLVARFTTTDNDAVTVDGIAQISQVTENDFSAPIDYIVTEGTNNTKYTVTIGKEAPGVWSKIAPFDTDSVMDIVMKVNPETDEPYIAYQQNRTNTADRKVAMVKLAGGAWTYVGSSSGISDGRADNYDLNFDVNGKPYVAYSDWLTTPTQRLSVKSFDGSSWAYAGTGQAVTDGKVTYKAMAFNANNNPMVFCMNDATSGTVLPRRALNISTYTSAWAINGTITGRGNDMYSYFPTTKLVNGTLYVAIFNANSPSTYSVYSYKNNTWTTIVDKALEAGATSSNLRDFDMDVDMKGNIYIAIADNAPSGGSVYKPRVKKYNAQTQTWSNVGDQINMDMSSGRFFDLAVSPLGVPYMLYRTDSSFPAVVYLDSQTKNWTEPVILDQFVVENLWLGFSSTGVGYAAYTNASNRTIVQKYDTPQ